jgi:subtilase family serine protease
MYLASGDIAGPQPPADDPFAISVGGTSLGLGKAGQRLFETGWSDGFSVIFNGHWQLHFEDSAASGGPSLLWPQPAYQRGVVPASMSSVAGGRGRGPVRSAPDISADADAFTGYKLGLLRFGKRGKTSFFQEVIGGTSLAAPLVAGLVADAQHGQRTPFGFADPALYKLAGTSALFDPLPLTSRSPLSWRALLCPASQCGEDRLIYLDDMSHNMGGYTGQVTGADTTT